MRSLEKERDFFKSLLSVIRLGLEPNKVAKVLKNASAEEVSVGEYMFEMLLDMDCNDELINEYFK